MLSDRPVYVTDKGLAELEAELAFLQTVKRPETVERLQDVRAGGDWMDNTEQMLIEEDLAFIDGRIQELSYMLTNAQLIGPDPDGTVVNIGDTVVIQAEGDGLEEYTIVGVAEADPAVGLISNESPLGRALLTRKVGDEVVVRAPIGALRYRIVAIT
jgi:transcription elongation factor GreA